jgi:uncharacterized protein YxjI
MSQLLELDRLVFRQKGKLIEIHNEYAIKDEEGRDVGMIRQEGQSLVRKAVRLVADIDQFLTHQLVIYDAEGERVLELVRPRKIFKSRLLVKDGGGRDVGKIVQRNVFGKIKFDLEGSSGHALGQIKAENWRAWNFSIVDSTDHEVARITKKWAGLVRAVFTTADNYVLEVQPSVSGDARLMILASAAAIDTALKQDERGPTITDFTP